MLSSLRFLLVSLAALLAVSAAFASGPTCSMGKQAAVHNHGQLVLAANAGDAAAPAADAPKSAYPLTTCIVSGEKLGSMGDPVVKTYDGREVQFCCAGCVKDFEKNKAKYLAKLDQAVIEQQKAGYPLTTCIVSGETLGEMGEPVDYVYNNQLVRFCCSGCIETFKKEPAKYLAKLASAEAPAAGETAPETGHEGHSH